MGVLGCMAERLKEDLLRKGSGVDLVVGPDAYRDLPRLLTILQVRAHPARSENVLWGSVFCLMMMPGLQTRSAMLGSLLPPRQATCGSAVQPEQSLPATPATMSQLDAAQLPVSRVLTSKACSQAQLKKVTPQSAYISQHQLHPASPHPNLFAVQCLLKLSIEPTLLP